MENGDAGMVGGVFALGITLCFLAVGFALTAFLLVGTWKMFVKAGQPGWASLVPFYNLYVLVTIVGLPVHWFYYFVILFGIGLILPFLSVFTGIATLVLSFYVTRLTHRAYGQNDDAVNVIISLFIPLILVYRTGFGPAQYAGPQALNDVPNLPWIDSISSRTNGQISPPPSTGSYIPTLSSRQSNETPLVNEQPMNIPPVSGGPSDPSVDMGSLPQMGSGNTKDQQQ